MKNLRRILREHKLWLDNSCGGKNADLRGADLRNADLQNADLQNANLRWADLQNADLQNADLQNANLREADLRGANLQNADLRGADLRNADLQNADLREADLREADLDFSSGIPFHCGGTNIKGNSRLLNQMIYHLTRQDWECTEEERLWLDSIPTDILNGFCKYRDDVDPV